MRYYPAFRRAIPHQEVDSYLILTRLPLIHPSFLRLKDFTARLACLRHTASIHPELGSNSQKNFNGKTPDLTRDFLLLQIDLPVTFQVTNNLSSIVKELAYYTAKTPAMTQNQFRDWKYR